MGDVFHTSDLCEALEPEVEEGNHEYKRHLVSPSAARFQELVTQLQYRLHEGANEALYELGVEDDGEIVGLDEDDLEESCKTLARMADALDADTTLVAERLVKDGKRARTMLCRKRLDNTSHKEVRITTVGNVDSGKSTILGVLTKGGLDNGRGLARSSVFKFKHEVESGRSSAVSQQVLGFATDGSITNYAYADVRETHSLRWSEIVTKSSKVIHFSDLCGHEKYLKTTMHVMTASLPDFAMLVVDSNRGGVVGMTKEHLSIMLGLKVPFFVVLTKVDFASKENRDATFEAVMQMLKRPGVHKMPIVIKNEQDVLSCCKTIAEGTITPVFHTSCVTGEGMDLIRLFLNHVPTRRVFDVSEESHGMVHLDDSFTVQGIGTVVSGVVLSGRIANQQQMLLGPDGNGAFVSVTVKGIQNKRVPVDNVHGGQTASFAIKAKKGHVTKQDIRKGMVLVDPNRNPRATWRFTAEVLILVHPTTLKVGYSPVLHCVTVRQAASICEIAGGDKEVLRTGDRALVTFEWCHRPEFLECGARIIFREGRTKGIGVIREIMSEVPRTEFLNYKNRQTALKHLNIAQNLASAASA